VSPGYVWCVLQPRTGHRFIIARFWMSNTKSTNAAAQIEYSQCYCRYSYAANTTTGTSSIRVKSHSIPDLPLLLATGKTGNDIASPKEGRLLVKCERRGGCIKVKEGDRVRSKNLIGSWSKCILRFKLYEIIIHYPEILKIS
jgi:hypothetical protein